MKKNSFDSVANSNREQLETPSPGPRVKHYFFLIISILSKILVAFLEAVRSDLKELGGPFLYLWQLRWALFFNKHHNKLVLSFGLFFLTFFNITALGLVFSLLWTLTREFKEVATVFFPLFDALVYGFINIFYKISFISKVGTFYLWALSLFIMLFYGFAVVWNYWHTQQVIVVDGFKWLELGSVQLRFGFLFDGLTINMIFVVLFISALVKVYSMGYMQDDPHQFRFFSYLSLFTFFMLVLVTGDNFIQMFLGWEGVGLCSYLLISFWSTRVQAVKSALKAMVVNRVGDCFLFFAICLIIIYYQSADYAIVFALVPTAVCEDSFYTNLIAFFLLVGAAGKSAQFGLHIWLPDAMEGPTPVSALIHAATMVTAGVFLIVRCSPLFEYSNVLPFMALWGAFTAIFAATIALFQYDMKKIIAYSTCSQLGYMFFACGTSNYHGAMFHLTTHAFFKALLFLAAGAVIHSFSDEQDIRKFGGVWQFLPFIYMAFLMGSLSLMGFPFYSGFYSKEYILQYAYVRSFHASFWLANIATLLTSIYSLRLIYYVFFNTQDFWLRPVLLDNGTYIMPVSQTNMTKSMYRNFHEPSHFMTIPLIFLVFLSIFSGYFLSDMFIGFDSFFFGNSILVLPEHQVGIAVETEVPLYVKILPLFYQFGIVFVFFSFRFFRKRLALKRVYKK